MAIELITGLPGNAKTLYAISVVKAKAEAESRPVFYSGIKDCKLPGWSEIDPLKWMDCPPGSIIFVDECQKTFRNRSIGANAPLHVTELEEHRHKGIDFFMVTQHPRLVDPAIKSLTQTHKHMVRVFGMEVSTVHRWNSIKDNPEKNSARADSEKTRWAFDKSLYGMYHSADEHNVKRHIPMRLKLLLLVPVLLGLAIWFVSASIMKKPVIPGVPTAQGQAPGMASNLIGQPGQPPVKVPFDPVADAKEYMAMATPRIVGLPQTAPKYDELTKPVRVPVPAMCIQMANACKCYSQQGTPMGVEFNMCIDFARNGFFQEFDPEQDRQDKARTAESVRVLQDRAVPIQTASSVVAFSNPPPDPPIVPRVGSGAKG